MQVTDIFGPIPLTVTLNGSGYGYVTFQPNGKNVRISTLFVAVSTSTKQAVAKLYKGQISNDNLINNTNSGSTGAPAFGNIDLLDGETLFVEWTGGDAGSIAKATVVGKTIPFDEVGPSEIQWSDPIAAGDGSLIFPAIKSINYVTGVSGWMISRDGNVEFAGGTFRGDVKINDTNGGRMTLTSQVPYGAVAFWQPDFSTIPGVTFQPAILFVDSTDDSGLGTSVPFFKAISPIASGSGGHTAQWILHGQDNLTSIDNSYVEFVAGRYGGIVFNNSTNTLDVPLGYLFYSENQTGTSGITTTEVDTLIITEQMAQMDNQRKYRAIWQGRVISSVAGDRVGVRAWMNGVTGVQIIDFGQITIATANVAQPFTLMAGFTGQNGNFISLGVRRVAGTGSISVNGSITTMEDVSRL
jgi:hypothetical protein